MIYALCDFAHTYTYASIVQSVYIYIYTYMKPKHIHILGAPISVQDTSCIEFLCIGSRDKDSTQKELESHVAGPFVK